MARSSGGREDAAEGIDEKAPLVGPDMALTSVPQSVALRSRAGAPAFGLGRHARAVASTSVTIEPAIA